MPESRREAVKIGELIHGVFWCPVDMDWETYADLNIKHLTSQLKEAHLNLARQKRAIELLLRETQEVSVL